MAPAEAPDPANRLRANYDRPRKAPDKRLANKGRASKPARPLPALVATPRSSPRFVEPQRSLGGDPPNSVAQIPGLPGPKRPTMDETPFAPLGVNAAGLRLLPFIEASGGFDSNPNRVAQPPKGSALARVDAGLSAKSDWSAHEARADLQGSYTRFLAAPEASRPEGTGTAALRVDVTRDTSADFQLRSSITTQRPGAPGVPGDVSSRPWVATVGATAGATQKFGRLEVSAAALVDRTSYEDAKLSGGSVLAYSRDNYAAYGLRTRIAFEATPGVVPFIEALGDRRVRDYAVDAAGYGRDSTGGSLRAGSKFEITRTLTGDLAAGYGQRRYEDSRLPLLAGPLVDGALTWAASPLTTVTARAATAFVETTLAGASGGLSHTVSVNASHALLRNVTLGAGVSLGRTDYRGAGLSQTTWTGALKAEYSLSRSLVLKGSYAHEQLLSSNGAGGYSADVFLLGLRLQR